MCRRPFTRGWVSRDEQYYLQDREDLLPRPTSLPCGCVRIHFACLESHLGAPWRQAKGVWGFDVGDARCPKCVLTGRQFQNGSLLSANGAGPSQVIALAPIDEETGEGPDFWLAVMQQPSSAPPSYDPRRAPEVVTVGGESFAALEWYESESDVPPEAPRTLQGSTCRVVAHLFALDVYNSDTDSGDAVSDGGLLRVSPLVVSPIEPPTSRVGQQELSTSRDAPGPTPACQDRTQPTWERSRKEENDEDTPWSDEEENPPPSKVSEPALSIHASSDECRYFCTENPLWVGHPHR